MIIIGVNLIDKQSNVQARNWEWTITINAINIESVAIPSMIIFIKKLHQAAWYDFEQFKSEWLINFSNIKWTNNEFRFKWLTKIFNLNMNKIKQSTWWLLIMNNHGNHITLQFDAACKELNIILLYMLLHSFHFFQLLDVGCFSLLKMIYIKKLENTFRFSINHVNKIKFLKIYKWVWLQIFIKSNILKFFRSIGFYPLDFTHVFDLLNIPLNPTTSKNKPQQTEPQSSLWKLQMFFITKQLNKQKKILNVKFKSRDCCPSSFIQKLLN